MIIREELFSPIVKTQVIDLLKRIDQTKFDIVIIWACRVDYLYRKRNEYLSIVSELKKYNIDVFRVPIIVLKFPLSNNQIRMLYMQIKYRLGLIIRDNNIKIIHARGYNAGYIASRICEEDSGIKSIFDARSPYLTELNSTYNINTDSKKYYMWSEIEKYILRNSTVSVATTEKFTDYLARESKWVKTIPNNAELENRNKILTLSKSQFRKSICYVGSIGYGWNDIKIYTKFAKSIIERYSDITFEFYVRVDSIQIVSKEFEIENIPANRYSVKSVSPDVLHSKIAGCLCGLQIMSKEDERLGIKTVDYLSAGLPIICNKNAIGATELVDKYGIGVSYDEEISSKVFEFIEKRMIGDLDEVIKCLDVAEKHFSTKAIAKVYENLYIDIMK